MCLSSISAYWPSPPVACATPRTNVVFPAPSSPVKRTTSPGRSLSPSSIPTRSVSAGELVTCSAKVVVAGASESRARNVHDLLGNHLADHVEARFGHQAPRPHAHKLSLLPARQRLLERGTLRTRNTLGIDYRAGSGHGSEFLHLTDQAIRDVSTAQAELVETAALVDEGQEPVGTALAQGDRRGAKGSRDANRPAWLGLGARDWPR